MTKELDKFITCVHQVQVHFPPIVDRCGKRSIFIHFHSFGTRTFLLAYFAGKSIPDLNFKCCIGLQVLVPIDLEIHARSLLWN
jgi:hypothetical protein